MIVVHFVIIVSTFVIANVSDPKLDSEGWIDLRVIVAKKRDPGILDPELFLAQIRKVEARLGKLAKIRKVETD